MFAPLNSNGWKQRSNPDSFLTFDQLNNNAPFTYLQVFGNGIIEAVNTDFVENSQRNRLFIYKDYEEMTFKGLSRFLQIQSNLGIESPLFIMLSLLGVKSYIMGLNPDDYRSYGSPIDRDTLVIPEITIEDFSCNLPQVMKPIFDAVWNAAGYPRSLNYDEEGNWQAK